MNSSGIIPLSKIDGEWNVFLIQYRGYEQFWGCPKGHIEPNETPEDAAIRELKEETDLEVKAFLQPEPLLEEFYWHKNGERLLKQVLFFIAEVTGTPNLQKEEIVGGAWFTLPTAIEKVLHPEGKATLIQTQQILQTL